MGADMPTGSRIAIPIQKNLLTLLLIGRTQDCLIAMQNNLTIKYSQPVNILDDNLLHYACKKNNYQIVRYILNTQPQAAAVLNKNKQYPIDLTTSSQIIDLMPKKIMKQNNMQKIVNQT